MRSKEELKNIFQELAIELADDWIREYNSWDVKQEEEGLTGEEIEFMIKNFGVIDVVISG